MRMLAQVGLIPGDHGDDTSEFQTVNWDAMSAVRDFTIIRVAYGEYHPDIHWAQNHPARDGRFSAVGIYGYLVAGQDPVAQANDWIAQVGDLGPNEFIALDHEEGDGDQTPRAQAAIQVLDQRYQRPTWFYSYVPFILQHIDLSKLGPRPKWIAGYGPSPSIPWDLWQHTDGQYGNHDCQPAYPGGPVCDCSVIPGGINALKTLIHATPVPPPPPAPPTPLPPEISFTLEGSVQLTRTPINVPLDGNGHGWMEPTPPILFDHVLSIVANGADPRGHGYIPVGTPSANADGTNTEIEAFGPPNGSVDFFIWHLT